MTHDETLNKLLANACPHAEHADGSAEYIIDLCCAEYILTATKGDEPYTYVVHGLRRADIDASTREQ